MGGSEGMGGESGDAPMEDAETGQVSATGAADGADADADAGADDGPTMPCEMPPDAEQGWIRVVDGSFQLDFGEYEWSDEVFGCDSEPPCEGPDGEHLRLFVPRDGEEPAPVGEFSVEAGTLSGAERWCGCCNGEGGGPPDWDETRQLDTDRLEIDGADANCVSGRWLERGGRSSERPFVARWCP